MATVRETEITEIYIATFMRAPDSAGLDYWVNSSLTIDEIASSFFDQTETQLRYPSALSDTEFVNTIYNNLFNRDADAAGLDYWVSELTEGTMTRDQMIMAVVRGALGTDDVILANKTEVGLYFAENGENLTYVQSVEVMANVDQTEGSVDAAIDQVDAWNEIAIAAPTIGTIAGDDIVDADEADAGFDITGTGVVGATVTVNLENGVTLAGGNTAVVDADGNWSVAVVKGDVTAIGEGAEAISATQESEGGVISPVSQPKSILVETVPPEVPPVEPPVEDFEITVAPAITFNLNDIANGVSLTTNEAADAGLRVNAGEINQETLFANQSGIITAEAQLAPASADVYARNSNGDLIISSTTVMLGTDGVDATDGNEFNNLIFGFKGDDVLKGRDGNDELAGGKDNDTLQGGNGNDKLYGETGNDILEGRADNDQLYGGVGADTLDGGTGNDLLVIDDADTLVDGGDDTDTVNFAADVDMTVGGKTWLGIEVATATTEGADLTLFSTQMTDLVAFNGVSGGLTEQLTVFVSPPDTDIDVSSITFNNSSATLTGDGVANILTGGTGADTISGLAGNDTLIGGAGADTLTGGAGIDTFVFANGDSGTTVGTIDEITDFSSDLISFGAAVGTNANYKEANGNGTADLEAFIANANTVLDGTVLYYAEYNINGSGDGYIAYSADGTVSEIVELGGLALNADIAAASII